MSQKVSVSCSDDSNGGMGVSGASVKMSLHFAPNTLLETQVTDSNGLAAFLLGPTDGSPVDFEVDTITGETGWLPDPNIVSNVDDVLIHEAQLSAVLHVVTIKLVNSSGCPIGGVAIIPDSSSGSGEIFTNALGVATGLMRSGVWNIVVTDSHYNGGTYSLTVSPGGTSMTINLGVSH